MLTVYVRAFYMRGLMCTVHILQNRYLLPAQSFKDCFISNKEKYQATKTQAMSFESYIETILKTV